MEPRSTILAFDAFLTARHKKVDCVIIGGTALVLLGVVTRMTRDCDVLCPPIDPEIAALAVEFAHHRQAMGEPLSELWWNNGPSSLIPILPPGWELRLVNAYLGNALRLMTLGRSDLLSTKVFALCDRGTDLNDCIALRPTEHELVDLLPWLEVQDLNPQWPEHARAVIADLGRKVGHGL